MKHNNNKLVDSTKLTVLILICQCINLKFVFSQNPEWMYLLDGRMVTSFAEDDENLWFCSTQYEYGDYIVIHKFDRVTKSIVDSIIYDGKFLDIDKNRNLWIAGKSGFAKFDGNKLTKWDNITIDGIKIKEGYINSIKIDNNNSVWMGTGQYGLIKFDGENFYRYQFDDALFPFTSIIVYDIDKDNNIWIGSNIGIAKFDGENWTKYNKENSDLPSNQVLGLKIDRNGNIWIGTNNGLAKFNNHDWIIFNSDLESNVFDKIAMDSSNNIWACSDKGVIKFDGVDFINYNTSNSGLRSNYIHSIFIDSYDNKWFSITDNMGLIEVDVFNENGIILTSVKNKTVDISSIKLSPNPTSDFITIQLSNKGFQPFADTDKVQIFDMLGIEVMSVWIGLDLSQQRIDVSHLPPGVYFIRIGDKLEKFVKM